MKERKKRQEHCGLAYGFSILNKSVQVSSDSEMVQQMLAFVKSDQGQF